MQLKEYWLQNKAPFKTSDDVPLLPLVDKQEWQNFYVPILIERGAIPKNKLIIGKTYYGESRNTDTAKWNGETFIYERHKISGTFLEHINHFEDDDGYDLFVPIKIIE